jgi:hypothetical protein
MYLDAPVYIWGARVYIWRISKGGALQRAIPCETRVTPSVSNVCIAQGRQAHSPKHDAFSTEKCQFSTEKCQLSTEKCQLSTEKCQLSTEKCQFSTHRSMRSPAWKALQSSESP